MADLITLRGVSARSRHGVLPEEKLIPQPFLVDLDLEADLSRAGRSDRLADTVSYATMAGQVHRVLIGPSVDLLEHLAEKIALVCLREPDVEAVTVTLHKPEAPVGVPCGDVEVRIRREREAQVVIAIGANLSASVERFADAVRRLSRLPGVDLRMLSPIVVSEPVGGPDGQPPYLNAVLLARTRLAALTLLRALHGIEEIHGRTRDVRWGPRTLDLDLIRYADPILGDARGDGETLTLPHP
ncbi:MAG: dihydroneopterin aldolase, partial [Dermatophilaceae bacterium]